MLIKLHQNTGHICYRLSGTVGTISISVDSSCRPNTSIQCNNISLPESHHCKGTNTSSTASVTTKKQSKARCIAGHTTSEIPKGQSENVVTIGQLLTKPIEKLEVNEPTPFSVNSHIMFRRWTSIPRYIYI